MLDIESLLSPDNVNQDALLAYAKEAANFSTNYQLPNLQFALNHRSQPDVDMFDFTCMSRSENAALVHDCNGAKLLIGLVGDCLVEVSETKMIVKVGVHLFYHCFEFTFISLTRVADL